MKKTTIKDIIIKILISEHKPFSTREIYDQIVEKNLYEFKSKTPLSIINSELRKNCKGIELKKSKTKKIFEQHENGKFSLIK